MPKKSTFPSDEDPNYEVGKDEEKYISTPENSVELVFRDNRSFDLHIGPDVYHFVGQNPVKVPRSVLNHKDWTDEIQQYFVVKE